jgi:hypothetical protein
MRCRDNDSTKSRAMEFKGKKYKFLIKSDGIELANCHGLEDEIPQNVKEPAADVKLGLNDGRINVPMFLKFPSG